MGRHTNVGKHNTARRWVRNLLFILAAPLLLRLPAISEAWADYTAWTEGVDSAAYVSEMEATNHALQVVFQYSEHALKELFLDYFYNNPQYTEFEAIETLPTLDSGVFALHDFKYHFWLDDIQVDIQDGERVALILGVEGYIVDLDTDEAPSLIDGPIEIELLAELDADAAAREAYVDFDAELDVDDLEVGGYLGGNAAFEAVFKGVIEQALESLIESIPPLEISEIYSVLPVPQESCDGVDNDTDGEVDEDCESCNGADDDGDGVEDEDCDGEGDANGVDDDDDDDDGIVDEDAAPALPESLFVDPEYGLAVGVHNLSLRTVDRPGYGTDESFLMVGFDLISLPDCNDGLGGYDLFGSDAWEDFDGNLIHPGHDMALSVSTRLLNRVFWNLIWMQELSGERVLDVWDDVVDQSVSHWSVTSWSKEQWTLPTNVDEIVSNDADDACDGFSDGAYVLDVDDEGVPYFKAKAWLHLNHIGIGCDSTLGAWGAMRFYIQNDEPGEPRLLVDLDLDAEINPTKWTDFLDLFGCDVKEELDEMEEEMKNGTREVSAVLLQELLDLHFSQSTLYSSSESYELSFDHMNPRPATLTISGRFETPWLGEPDARLSVPSYGGVAGLCMPDQRADCPAVDGYEPALRNCPPGWISREFSLDGEAIGWCEYVVDDGVDPDALPEGVWCGLDVHPRWVPEICDNIDNDGDGDVDEDFMFGVDEADLPQISGQPVAECYHTLANGTADTSDDRNLTYHTSTCGDLNPRDGCPAGLQPLAIWLDADYAICLKEDAGAPWTGSYCSLTEAEILAGADLVTCVSEGSSSTADVSELAGGLVGAGYITDYSTPQERFDGEAACPAGTTAYVLDTSEWDQYLPSPDGSGGFVLDSELVFCAADGRGADADGDRCRELDELELGSDTGLWSTDLDALPDCVEYLGVSNALGEEVTMDPTLEDTDEDYLNDFVEVLIFGTDPSDDDTDADGLPDGYEVWVTYTDPVDEDTDDNGVLDGEEETVYDAIENDDWYEGMKPDDDYTAGGEGSGGWSDWSGWTSGG